MQGWLKQLKINKDLHYSYCNAPMYMDISRDFRDKMNVEIKKLSLIMDIILYNYRYTDTVGCAGGMHHISIPTASHSSHQCTLG